jgi:hypothetical protein
MRVKAFVNVKYEGKTYPPGSEIDVKKEVGDELVSAGHAEVLDKPTPKPRGPKSDEQSTDKD